MTARSLQPAAATAPIDTSKSGLYPLPDGAEAFAARAGLAIAAERTIDAQYYIWHADLSGTLLFAQLVRAASRGVRVRLLIDDNNTSGLDPTLSVLDAHPNIEVRLFNPFRHRRGRWLDYLLEFGRLNRRMHNKSFTVDGRATIVGGRNVGDEYFAATEGTAFEDLDLLGAGPVVDDVCAVFERYWHSESAVPVARLAPAATHESGQRLVQSALVLEASERASRYRAALADAPITQSFIAGHLDLDWADVKVVSDPPQKVLAHGRAASAPVLERLRAVLGDARDRVDIVSPYFVPTAAGVAALCELAKRGVKIRVLTNSLAATDVAAVHAGYAKYRKPLLDAGVSLYELKPTLDRPGKRGMRGGSSGASLHAKTFSVDGKRAYVGSFNFDPRSARLNTEMGVIVESPVLASRISEMLDRDLPTAAYQVRATASGALEWRSGELVFSTEPEASRLRRIAVQVLSVLPIEGLL